MTEYCERANLPIYNDSSSTLLIIDEIQVSKEIYNKIRWFDNKLGCDVIVTGSYLGGVLREGFFQPAGNIIYRKMYNISFREFCRIFGEESRLNSISLCGTSGKMDYERIYSLYDIYLRIGGYPAVIKEYIKTKNMQNCDEVLNSLIQVFYDESKMYFTDNNESLIMQHAFEAITIEMCKSKRGSKLLDSITKNIIDKDKKIFVTRQELYKAIDWMEESGVVGSCDLMEATNGIPQIKAMAKIYYTDCGIAYKMLRSNKGIDDNTVKGLLAEHFVYCELQRLYPAYLVRAGELSFASPCFMIYGDYELDFVVTSKERITYGIEVKYNNGTPKSLQTITSKKFIDKPIVVKRTQGGNTGGILTIPIFTVGCRFPYE